MRALLLVNINLNTKFEMPSFNHSKDYGWAPKFKNGSRDSDHSLSGAVCRL